MIRLETLNKEKLRDFMNSGRFQSFDFLPITKHRAISQLENPRANSEDILLTLAFDGEKLAGYLGTLPDEIWLQNQKIKFAWLSTLFVHENFRGKRIAQQLLDEVFLHYHDQIAITEFTKEAENLYLKTKKFDYVNPKIGKRFYFLSDLQTILPAKKPIFREIKPLLQLTDASINSLVSFHLKNSKKSTIKVETSPIFDEECAKFLQKFTPNSSARSEKELNWVLQNPWILERDYSEKNYLFSSYSKEFKHQVIKIFSEKKLSIVAIVQWRDGHLKIPYFFAENHLDDFILYLNNFINANKIKRLTSFHEKLNHEILEAKQLSFLHQKNLERRYFMSKKLRSVLPENYQFDFLDGDGDCIFT